MNRFLAACAPLSAAAFALLLDPTRAAAGPGQPPPMAGSAIPKYVDPLVIPPVMPARGVRWDAAARRPVPYYEIEMVQFDQQVLPTGMPRTTVWSYGAVGRPETRNYPAFTIENLKGLPTRVKWVNGLVDGNGDYLPHLLPVDQSLHWANPGKLPCLDGTARTDCRPAAAPQTPYQGPVPMITHVHGAHVRPESDGYPEAWYLPAARNIPAGHATRGTHWGQIAGAKDEAGAATFQYPNDQPATTLWYHDHTLGMTRTNVYAGPAGFYLVRDLRDAGLRLPGPPPLPGTDPNGNALVRRLVHEIPIVIQGRSFNDDGSFFYPDNRDYFEGLVPGTLSQAGIRFSPDGGSDVAPIWNPEFFGNAMVVNGKTWPRLEVEPRRYRLRLLNGSDARFLILRFEGDALSFQQIGADQGFLPSPVTQTRLLLGPAERADVVVDFSALQPGDRILLQNLGPDEPFGGGEPCLDFTVPCDFLPADPGTTGQVMAFDVVAPLFRERSRVPAVLPAEGPQPAPTRVRTLSLNEEESATEQICVGADDELIVDPGTANDPVACAAAGGSLVPFGPTAALLGTLGPDGTSTPLLWAAAVTENPALGATEAWEIYNFTADAHPIHLHLVRFQVTGRERLATDDEGIATQPAVLTGEARGPEAGEAGYKDTVIAYPGEVTRVTATFDLAGLYVWHCHILEHEDNEMMRPYCVGGQDTCPLPIAGDL
jgi:FtsP/CotA-like multicopper oxidase with cupredoxin domain